MQTESGCKNPMNIGRYMSGSHQARQEALNRIWLRKIKSSNSLEHSPTWVVNRCSGSQEIPRIAWNQKFITAFVTAHHLSLSWARSMLPMPLPTSWRFILILSSYLCLGLPSGLLPSGIPTKFLYAPLISPIRATCPAHLRLDLFTRIIFDEYRW
jgi:hypothetical protein